MHLHIGKNNVIGRALSRNGLCDVLSIVDLLGCNKSELASYSTVSISAFNPVYKKRLLTNEDPLAVFLKDNLSPSTHIVYISTARVLEKYAGSSHHYYAENKRVIAENLRDKFFRFSCLFIPNIIPNEKFDSSDFIDQYLRNLKYGIVKFDCDEESYWNYIDPDLLSRFIVSLKNPIGNRLIINTHNLYVKELVMLAQNISRQSELEIRLGSVRRCYPLIGLNTPQLTYLTSRSTDWILNRKEILKK